MTHQPNRLGTLCGLAGAASVVAIVLMTQPVLAQGPDISPITDLINNFRTSLIRLLQAVLALAMVYFVGIIGIGQNSSHAIKKLGLSMIAFAGLELFNRLVLNPVQQVSNGTSSGGTTDSIGAVDPSAAMVGLPDGLQYATDFAITAFLALPV
jgi:hypothetical protein